MNHSQAQYLQQHGLTEATIGAAHPDLRLEYANRAVDIDPPAPATPELTGAQREYLGDRRPEDLTSPLDRENFEALGADIFRPKPETEAVEAAKAITPPVPLNWSTAALDSDKLAGESVGYRLSIANEFEAARLAGPSKATEAQTLIFERYARR